MNFSTWLFPQRVTAALGWTLLHSLWQGALAALGLAAVLFFLRRSSARTRYAMGLFVMVLVLAVSVMTFWNQFSAAAPFQAVAGSLRALPMQAGVGPESAAAASAGPGLGQRIATFFSVYFNRHLPLLVTLWLLGVLFMSLRFAGGMLHVQRLRYSQTRPLPAPWPARVEVLAARAGLSRPLAALESLRLRTPMVIGHFKPLLLLPVGLVTGLSAGEVEALLAHELAHVRRRDYLVNVLQNLLDILYFFHPGVRWISACVRQEREHCCDDIAVELCGDPRDYARALASLPVRNVGLAEPAVAALGRPQRLLQRIVRLLRRPRQIPEFREGFVSALLLVFGLLAMLKLVAAGSAPMEATVADGQAQQVYPAAATDRFVPFAFTLEKDGMVELSGKIPNGWNEQPGTWILSDDDGGLALLKFLDGGAGKGSAFSEEVSLKAGAYRWYLPAGCSASLRVRNGNAWAALKLRPEAQEVLIERRRGADGALLPLRSELLGQLAELLAGEKARQEVPASQRLREEEERRQLLQLTLEQKRMKEEEKKRLEHERQALAVKAEVLKEEQLRLEQELRAQAEFEKSKSSEEKERLKAEQERLFEQQRRATAEAAELRNTQHRHQEQANRARAELDRLKAEAMELKARQEVEEMAARLAEMRAKEDLMRREVEHMRAEEKNLKALFDELVAASLIDRNGKYKVELSARALVVNAKKQPPAVHERIKKFYEDRFGRKLGNDKPLTILSD